jgi:hypothetical protein
MSTPADVMARELRNELEARINQWKAERTQLLQAQTRIAELDALIAYAEDGTKTEFRVAPRPVREAIAEQTAEQTAEVATRVR